MTTLALPRQSSVGQTHRVARSGLRTWTAVTALISVLALWTVLFGLVLSALGEHSAQARLFATLRQELAEGRAPVGPVAAGSPVAVLGIPRLGLHSVVVEGTGGAELREGPGHRRDTVLPGQEGVSVLFGRGATGGAPFARLMSLQKGDHIDVTTGQGVQRFVVERLRRPGDPLPLVMAPGSAHLVLGSLAGTGWRAGWAPDRVVYVDAVLDGHAQPAAARPAAVPAAERLGGVDASRVALVVLWLQALVVAALASAWALERWGTAQTWVVGIPVLLGLLWVTSTQAWCLLPNAL